MSRSRLRPLAFGARLRDGDRTLRVRREARGYAVVDSARGRDSRERSHSSLESALRDLARSWRNRLH